MKRALVIIGAGSHGRGVLEVLLASRAVGGKIPEVAGFVDDAPSLRGTRIGGLPVLGPVEWLLSRKNDGWAAILALADPAIKRTLEERLRPVAPAYETAVHPAAVMSSETTVSPGAVVCAGAVLAYRTRIGRHVTVNLGATVGHDCVIGDYCTIAPGVNVTGRVRIGPGALIQTNATVVPGVVIGAGAHVGPGSVVLRDVAPGDFVFGNPARKLPRALEQRAWTEVGGFSSPRDDSENRGSEEGRSDRPVRGRIQAVVEEVLGGNGATDPLSAARLDSVGMIHLLAGLEDEFGISIPPEEITPSSFASVESLVLMMCRIAASREH